MIGTSRGWVRLAVVGAIVVVAGFAAVLLLRGGGDDTGVDCSTFRVTPDAWAKADYNRRIQLQRGLLDCGTLDGQPDTEVVATLGPPDRNGANEIDYYLPYGAGSTDRQVWRIRLDREHRVTSSTTETP